jgi:hypothetical protein
MVNSEIDWTAVSFVKSSHSGTTQGQCVEVGVAPGAVGVRDSKLGTTSPVLVFTPARWASFMAQVKAGALTA